ncbi:MAG: iron complex outermembrane receptor protein [Saprospiraceae bacterium]|jgi:iron complex outermembrane receptor protein
MKKTFILLFMAFSQFMISQNVTGVVTDDSGEPLIGASVMEKGTSSGTITDIDGSFSLNVTDMAGTLIFSYVGYTTQEVAIDGRSTANVTLTEGNALDEIVFVGSRAEGRTKLTTAVPVDVIDISGLLKSSPQVNLNQILNFVAPSFTSNVQNISDGTDHIDPASLRGLGPDQVLVLINGKRRHTSSLINVNGTFGRGSVGTDLNAIPAAAIARIEVLRDGAAAQYGSDAIAGVINIILKEQTDELTLVASYGSNMSKNANNQTGGSDGASTNISANYGVGLNDKGAFINFTGDFDVREEFSRMKEWEGNVFNSFNTVERFAQADGYDIANLQDDDVTDVIQYSNAAGIDLAGATSKAELQEVLSADNTDAELAARGLTRSDFNMRVGQSALRGGRFFANFAYPLNDSGTEIYANAGVSKRAGNSAGFYRLPNQSRTYTPAYNNGFLPEINSKIGDKSMSTGIRGKVNDWSVDFSNSYGTNSFLYEISNTSNASMLNATPTRFDAGGFSFAQNTTNLDLNHKYDDIFSGLNVAFGAEHRYENYAISAGELPSYAQFDEDGNPITTPTQTTRKDFFGNTRPGGSQVFPGFAPANEVDRVRSSVAGYIDLEADVTETLLLGVATRYENYSDFGSTVNFKGVARLRVTDKMTIRAAANTGFRAPSLHQLNFNSTSTIFDQDGNPVEVGTFANDSRAAKLLGIPELKEETSTSISAGITAAIPSANLSITLDGYIVNIDDRVVYTGQFKGPGTGSELDNLLKQANASAASFFANAIDTKSTGLDFVITHKTRFGSKTQLKSDLSGTLSKTERVGDIKASEVLENAGLVSTYFPEDSRIYLEKAVPRTKASLSNSLTMSKLNVFLRNTYFGEVTEATNNLALQQEFSSKVITDLSVSYKFTDAITLTLGANNLLDIYPDRAEQDLDLTTEGDQNNRSGGRFDWSRRAQQFGIGGRYAFARFALTL